MRKYKLLLLLGGITVISFAGCNLFGNNQTPEVEDSSTPGTPEYAQFIIDCETSDTPPTGDIFQPPAGCDSWEINRYERPFNANTQDEYYPDLDIWYAEIGQTQSWIYLRLTLDNVRFESGHVEGAYGMEMDMDIDGRGDYLLAAVIPDVEDTEEWRTVGIQLWRDTDNDVGNLNPMSPDHEGQSNGYDEVVYDQRSQTTDAWARAILGEPSFVEIAFKAELIGGADSFKWWAWSDQGVQLEEDFDYHDFYKHLDAGDAIEGQAFFPSLALHALDNTCAAIWGGLPNEDPTLCSNELSAPEPTPPPTETTRECPPLSFTDWKDWMNSISPNFHNLPGGVKWNIYKYSYLPGFDCPETPTPTEEYPPPPECPPMGWLDWLAWMSAQYGAAFDNLPLLAQWFEYMSYKGKLDCPPTEIPTDPPPGTLPPPPSREPTPSATFTVTPTNTRVPVVGIPTTEESNGGGDPGGRVTNTPCSATTGAGC